MKRLAVLMVVAMSTLLVLIFITHPEWLDKAWLWVIGFIGYILVLFEKGTKILTDAFKKKPGQDSTQTDSSLPGEKTQRSQWEMMDKRLTQIENHLKKKDSTDHWSK